MSDLRSDARAHLRMAIHYVREARRYMASSEYARVMRDKKGQARNSCMYLSNICEARNYRELARKCRVMANEIERSGQWIQTKYA